MSVSALKKWNRIRFEFALGAEDGLSAEDFDAAVSLVLEKAPTSSSSRLQVVDFAQFSLIVGWLERHIAAKDFDAHGVLAVAQRKEKDGTMAVIG